MFVVVDGEEGKKGKTASLLCPPEDNWTLDGSFDAARPTADGTLGKRGRDDTVTGHGRKRADVRCGICSFLLATTESLSVYQDRVSTQITAQPIPSLISSNCSLYCSLHFQLSSHYTRDDNADEHRGRNTHSKEGRIAYK